MKSKKAAEFTIVTLVVIVLAIIVLVVLVLGFGTGWSNLWSKIAGFLGSGVNIDSQAQACVLACSTGSTYDFCTHTRTIIYIEADGGKEKIEITCNSWSNGQNKTGGEITIAEVLSRSSEVNCPEITCS